MVHKVFVSLARNRQENVTGTCNGLLRRIASLPLILGCVVPLLLCGCSTISSRIAPMQKVTFDVVWGEDAARQLRPGAPVQFDIYPVGKVVRVEKKYDVKTEKTLVYTRLKVTMKKPDLRVNDKFTTRIDPTTGKVHVQVTPVSGNRMKFRLVESGMILQGSTRAPVKRSLENAKGALKEAGKRTRSAWQRLLDRF